jgi:Bifunctional DNA primase/polymerase, N-terminal/AAA domain
MSIENQSINSSERSVDGRALSALAQAAIDCARRGLPVIPCWPGTKKPRIRWQGRRLATLEEVEEWWTQNPDDNIAMVPADLDSDGGCLVIDLDNKAAANGVALWERLKAEHGPVDETFTVRTPSGGFHLYFWSKRNFGNGKPRDWQGIDVRSAAGYVVAPPSIIDDRDEKACGRPEKQGTYEVVSVCDPAELPEWVANLLSAARPPEERAHNLVAEGVTADAPNYVAAVVEYLTERAPIAIEGNGGDNTTIEVANFCGDFAVTAEVALELMAEHWNDRCEPPWDLDGSNSLRTKVESAYKSRQTPIGSQTAEWIFAEGLRERANGSIEQQSGGTTIIEEPDCSVIKPPTKVANEHDGERRARRFQCRLPSEDESLEALTYYDDERTMPCVPDGATLIVVGQKQSHKTGIVMKKCLDAMGRVGAKVLYVAAEGAHGIRTIRLPAYREARGLDWGILDERWRTLSASFDLFSGDDRAELIEEYRTFNPDILVLDTLTRVIPGQDINGPSAGGGINIYAEELANAFNALVILIHHPGKNDRKDALGSTLITSLAYAVWIVSAEDETVKVYVDKMKDGKAEFAVHYKVGRFGAGVPVIEDLPPGERPRGMASTEKAEMLNRKWEVIKALQRLNGPGGVPITVRLLAEELVPAEPGESPESRTRRVASEERNLQRAVKGKRGQPGYLSEFVELDRHGQPVKPYVFILPRGYCNARDEG